MVVLEDGWIEKLGKENPAVEEKPQSLDVTLDNLAYIVYSSGTTGKPKGKLRLSGLSGSSRRCSGGLFWLRNKKNDFQIHTLSGGQGTQQSSDVN